MRTVHANALEREIDERRHIATGVVTIVQENRFHLRTDDGAGREFVLAHDAPLEGQDLPPLQRSQARVRVEYERSNSLIAGIAHHIYLLDQQDSAS